jgi:TolB-like protein/Tfp pilus assembly protein PilF
MSFFRELKRRNVVKVALLYVVASWIVLQVTDVLVAILPVPDWSATLVFMLLVLGLVPTLIFSWVYEITPNGIRRDNNAERGESNPSETARRMDRLIIVLLALAITIVVLDRVLSTDGSGSAPADRAVTGESATADGVERSGQTGRMPAEPMIVVLPFVNTSPDPDQEYFSDGLSEELLNLVSDVPGTAVVSRTTAFSFKGKDVTIAEVAERLRVTHVLEGSVRKSGDHIRVTARLVDAAEDRQLWSDSWDRTLGDIFDLQDEIAAKVIDALKVTLLGGVPTSARTDPGAYTFYLRGRQLFREGSRASLLEAVAAFRKALNIDPNFVPAWIGLGSSYSNLAGARGLPQPEAYREAEAAARQALAIDPDSAAAYAGLAWVAIKSDGDFAAAARSLRHALSLAPKDTRVLNAAAELLRHLGRIEDSLAVYEWLLSKDPLSPTLLNNLALAHFTVRELPAAEDRLEETLDLSPDMFLARVLLARVYFRQGRLRAALDETQRITKQTGDEAFALIGEAFAYRELGRAAEGMQALTLLEQKHSGYASIIGLIHADQRRVEPAITWFERAYELDGADTIALLKFNPWLLIPADHPRWLALQERAGVADAQLAAIELDVGLPFANSGDRRVSGTPRR